MGRKKKVEEIADIAPQLAKAAEDGVITDKEIADIVNDTDANTEDVINDSEVDTNTTEEQSTDGGEPQPEADVVPESDTDGIDETPEADAGLDGQNNEGDLVDNSSTDTTQDPIADEDKETEEVPKLDAGGVASVISHADYTGKQKINKIADEAIVGFASIASKIIGYDQIMNPKTPVTDIAGVAKQYDLLNTLKSVINTEDYKKFKVKFDIINLGFRAYNKDAFDEFMLFRFDQKWRWSKKDLTTSQHLSSLISQLCDLTTRAQNLKKIDIDRALDASEITLSETGISNLKKYYTM